MKIDNQKLLQKLNELKSIIKKDITKKYKADGTINYSFSNNEINYDKEIIPLDNRLRILAISDLHIGNELERPDLLYRAFNYCTKEGIYLIMCCGDILDGTYTSGKQNITDVYKQLNRFIKLYPYDDNILTFALAGDHDESILTKFKIDIVSACENHHPDIIISNYGNDDINVSNDTLHLFHKGNLKKLKKSNGRVILCGHNHQFKTAIYGEKLNINVPTLSDITENLPSTLDIELFLNNKKFKGVEIKHIYFGHKDMILSEQEIDLPPKKKDEPSIQKKKHLQTIKK